MSSWIDTEIENFERILKDIKAEPGDIPSIPGIQIHGRTLPLKGTVGGDHIIYMNFGKRYYDLEARMNEAQECGNEALASTLEKNKTRGGILIADVAGHELTDGALSMGLHQAFLALAEVEMDLYGEITAQLFERLNNRFYKSSSVRKYITMLYGEISSGGTFRYINAGHPSPAIYRSSLSFTDCKRSTPLGMIPSRTVDAHRYASPLGFKAPYVVNEAQVGPGDILILYTDGVQEHGESDGKAAYLENRLEGILHDTKNLGAEEICDAVLEDVTAYAPQRDDITCVVVKNDPY